MKTNNSTIRKLIAVVAISCFSTNTTFAQLNGTYTIGANPTDSFASFTEAVDTLVSQGVSGPVIFDVQSGVYAEQFTITPIAGASATNTITFQSLAQDSTAVLLTYNSTSLADDYIIKLDSADYFIFRKLSFYNGGAGYSRVFHLRNGANNHLIENNLISGTNTGNSSNIYALIYGDGTQDQNNVFRNSLFVNGSYGIYFGGLNPATLSSGNQANNNQFIDQSNSAIYFDNQNSPQANGNIIEANGFGAVEGIYLYECDNALQVNGNRISGTSLEYGIYLSNCTSTIVQKGSIANNFIIPDYSFNIYGIRIDACQYQNVYHNSVLIPESNTQTGSIAFYVSTGGSNLDIKNNIFANFGAGYAYYAVPSAPIAASNYNNLFSLENFIGNWGGTNAEDLTAWKTLSGKDANSLSVNPVFFSSSDLHTTTFRLESMGTPLPSVTTDIDGEVRSGATPDIGADEFTGAGTALCGTYTIGGVTPDFPNFSLAADSLNEVGISCPVTFNVRNGNYTEQFSVIPVAGASVSNRVTFQSESGDSSLVILGFNSGANNNYVVWLKASDYINFRKMTITSTNTLNNQVFLFSGNTRSDSISNCVLSANGISDNIIGAGTEAYFNDIAITSNIFSSGARGVLLNGLVSIHSTGVQIINNTFTSQETNGVYLEDCDAPKISGNDFSAAGGWNYYSIRLEDCDNSLEISKNVVNSQNGYGGIYLANCNGTGVFKGLISNNFIEIGGTANAYGIYMNACDYQRIYYNSIRITSTDATNGRALFTNSTLSNNELKNNIFSNFGGGYTIFSQQAGTFASSDYNDFFTTGSFTGYWVSAGTTDLSAWQIASGLDVNSVSVNPAFVSPTDLHAQSSFIDGKGIPVSVITDIDGQSRDPGTPDIGADEFTSTLTPLCGTYTIGGITPDYSDFIAAVNDLSLRGISCPVVFNARNDIYTEQIELLPVTGATATDSIIFQSESGDSTAVTLTFSASSAKDYVIQISNADYITFRKMTIAPTASNNEGVAVNLSGNVKNFNLLNNIISGSISSWEYLVKSDIEFTQNVRITDNIFSESERGVSLRGSTTPQATGTVVSGNFFNGQDDHAIFLENQSAPVVMGNTINMSGGAGYYGIELLSCSSALVVKENKVFIGDYYDGIYINTCNTTVSAKGVIANNFVWVGGNWIARGIYLNNSAYQDVVYNNVRITSTDAANGKAFYSSSGNNQRLLNNVFANTGGGYSYYIDQAIAISESDYNDLYGTGTNFAYWDVANYTTLAGLQGASTMDINSISVNPQFYSTTNLHVLQAQLMGNANPYPAVNKDIDGQQRDPVTPDIGADEFFCQTPVFNVSVTEPCLGDSTTFTDMTTGVEPNSTFAWDFNGDGVVDYTSFTPNQTIKHLYFAPDTFTVRLVISQIAGCVDTLTFLAIVNTFPDVSFTKTGVYCDSANGTATAIVSGGTPAYTYLWSTGSTAQTITGLNLGLYTVTVNDANNCAVIDTVKISESMSVTVAAISAATCGNADGIASVDTVIGGYPPYNYVWSNGDTTDTDSTLTAGVNYVTVIDTNGCVAFGTVTISNSGIAPSISGTSINNNCSGDENGSINLSVISGTPPYTYLWSNGSITEDIDSLIGGIYEVTVTDAAGCISTGSYPVFTPDLLTVSVIKTDAGCGNSDGSAFVVVSGGTTPYTYLWSSGGTNEVETGLSAGIYTVTVTDANGCSKIKPVLINNIGGPVIAVVSKTDVDCNNPSDGAIDISVTGGAPSYTYSWSTGDTIQDINNLDTGTYNVTVTDASGCIAAASIEIKDKIPAVQPICVVTVDTATGKNLIVWQKTPGENIASFNIYREGTQSGVYLLVGSSPYDSLSTFSDTLANPQQRAWRYKMTAVDSCGKESVLSPIHKTIHLTMNLGLGGTVNLIWDNYQGFIPNNYALYRGCSADSLVPFQFVTGNSETDPSPPACPDLFYMIAAEPPSVCIATKKAENYNSSKSNTATSVAGGSLAPAADFTANTTSIAVGGSVNFTDLSVNSPTSWAWTFAGGTPGSSNLQDPSNIVYNTPGSYDATLIATNVNGSDTMTKVSYITVTSTGAPPVANFLGCTTINIGNSVSFLDQSQNSPTSWVWSFENGNPAFSTDQNPTGIVYNTSGTFYVQLIVTNANGSDTLITQSCINVNPVGINENTPEGALMIYPNPGRGVFTVEVYDLRSAIYDLSIYDVLGREIQKSKIKNQKSEINLSGQPAGIYHLQVITGNGVVNRKVVIE